MLNGQFQKISIHYDGSFLEFRGQGGFLWTGILKASGSTCTYIWNSEGLKLLILWTLPVLKWSTTERHDTDDDSVSAGYRRSIDRSGMYGVLKKANKTWVVHQIHEFLDDEYQINKIQQIFIHVCTLNIDAPVRIWWTLKTRTSPLLL